MLRKVPRTVRAARVGDAVLRHEHRQPVGPKLAQHEQEPLGVEVPVEVGLGQRRGQRRLLRQPVQDRQRRNAPHQREAVVVQPDEVGAGPQRRVVANVRGSVEAAVGVDVEVAPHDGVQEQRVVDVRARHRRALVVGVARPRRAEHPVVRRDAHHRRAPAGAPHAAVGVVARGGERVGLVQRVVPAPVRADHVQHEAPHAVEIEGRTRRKDRLEVAPGGDDQGLVEGDPPVDLTAVLGAGEARPRAEVVDDAVAHEARGVVGLRQVVEVVGQHEVEQRDHGHEVPLRHRVEHAVVVREAVGVRRRAARRGEVREGHGARPEAAAPGVARRKDPRPVEAQAVRVLVRRHERVELLRELRVRPRTVVGVVAVRDAPRHVLPGVPVGVVQAPLDLVRRRRRAPEKARRKAPARRRVEGLEGRGHVERWHVVDDRRGVRRRARIGVRADVGAEVRRRGVGHRRVGDHHRRAVVARGEGERGEEHEERSRGAHGAPRVPAFSSSTPPPAPPRSPRE